MTFPKIHFMGISGSGASAAAAIATSYGYQISGCDINKDSSYFKHFSLKFEIGHDPRHVKDINLLIVSPAILKLDPKNQEVNQAKKRKIPVLTWQQFMGKYLQKDKFVIAISGTHGKSTTTAMVGHILEDAGFDPTVEIGAIDLAWGKNFRIGKSRYFVCEADEYNNNFLNYKSDIAVITNIDFDHPDFFNNEEVYFQSFEKFIFQNSDLKHLIIFKGQLGIDKLLPKIKKLQVVDQLFKLQKFNLKLTGQHNLVNANLAFEVAVKLGIKPATIKKSLEKFKGLERRFEYQGKIKNTKIYQDFAHHPTELKALFESINEKFVSKKIWCVFQPHTYSRTKTLRPDFVTVFQNSNLQKIIISPIFAAREKHPKEPVSSAKLAKMIGNKAQYLSDFNKISKYISKNLNSIDVLFIVGAGDIYKLSSLLNKNGI